jgi:hypothetical protein
MPLRFPAKRSLSRSQLEATWDTFERLADESSVPRQPRKRFSVRSRPGWAMAFALLLVAAAIGLFAPGVGLVATLTPSNDPDPAAIEKTWRDTLAEAAEADPDATFANLSSTELNARLDRAARDLDFSVVSVELLKPAGVAPHIVVKASDQEKFSRDVPALMQSLDPHVGPDDRTGWAFEGFFLKALDDEDQPFLIVFNHWRGDSGGGGAWTRSPALDPFPSIGPGPSVEGTD